MAGRPSGRCVWGWMPRARSLIAVLCALAALGLIVTSEPESVGPSPLRELAVDPNTAPVAVLAALPRVGPAMAARIVEAREWAPLAGPDDLDLRVHGIGPATIAALRPHLRFSNAEGPPDVAARLASRPRPGRVAP